MRLFSRSSPISQQHFQIRFQNWTPFSSAVLPAPTIARGEHWVDKAFPLLAMLFVMSYLVAALATVLTASSSAGSLPSLPWEYTVGLSSAFQQDCHSGFFLPKCTDSSGHATPINDLSIFSVIRLFKNPLDCNSTVQHVDLDLLKATVFSNVLIMNSVICVADEGIGSGILCLLATNCISSHRLLPCKPSNPANSQTA